MALQIGSFDELPGERGASREAADYWRRILRGLGLSSDRPATVPESAAKAANRPTGGDGADRMPGGFQRGDTSGFHPGKDDALIEGALKQVGADRMGGGDAGGDLSELVETVRELRRGNGVGGSDEQRRILATLIGPGEASKVERFTRNASRTGQASARQNDEQTERSARLAEIRARERSAAAERADNPAEAQRLREAARRLLEQAERKRKMAGL